MWFQEKILSVLIASNVIRQVAKKSLIQYEVISQEYNFKELGYSFRGIKPKYAPWMWHEWLIFTACLVVKDTKQSSVQSSFAKVKIV